MVYAVRPVTEGDFGRKILHDSAPLGRLQRYSCAGPWVGRLLMAMAIAAKLCAANGWERLSGIRSGDVLRVVQDVLRVVQMDRKEYHGTFIGFSAETIFDSRDRKSVV